MKNITLILSLISIIIFINYQIYTKEQIFKSEDIIFLELAPSGPYSEDTIDPELITSDKSINLRYRLEFIERLTLSRKNDIPGHIIITKDNENIAVVKDLYKNQKLNKNDKLLRYHNKNLFPLINSDTIYFKKKEKEKILKTKYGVFKFDKKGNYLLIGVADENRKIIYSM